jgi:hypothetical protein
VAVERHPRFEAQGVARGEARRDEAERRARGEQSVPEGGATAFGTISSKPSSPV